MSLFKPYEILDTYTDFDIVKYKSLGYKAVFLDIDNTIAIPHSGVCDQKAEKFIKSLKDADFIVCLFSNSKLKRVKLFKRDLDVDYKALVFKPLPFSFIKNTKHYNIKPNETIVIGDQLLTDILGANISGCIGIYSKQLQEKDTFLTSINRFFEKLIWRFILHEEV